jgi:FAD/FMN-containing dehydrogenase
VLRHIPGSRDPLRDEAPWYALIELSGNDPALDHRLERLLSSALEAHLLRDAVIAQDLAQAGALWALRENISEAQRLEGFSVKHDISVPVSRIPLFIEAAGEKLAAALPGVRVVVFGHAGDGNLHYNLSFPDAGDNAQLLADCESANALVYETVLRAGRIDFGGARHRTAQARRSLLEQHKGIVEMDLMQGSQACARSTGVDESGKAVLGPIGQWFIVFKKRKKHLQEPGENL